MKITADGSGQRLKHARGPGENGGFAEEGFSVHLYGFRGHDEMFNPPVLGPVEINVAESMHNDKVVCLMGVHVPGTLDVAYRAG